ncbi:MAG: GIY-YIG nuclease family protein [Paraclostridium sp.]
MECLYVKRFENGKMYVGITNNFDKRMESHNRSAFIEESMLPVHCAMRKYRHTTEVWSSDIDDRELILMLEVQTIEQLKNAGIELYNLTIGGEGVITDCDWIVQYDLSGNIIAEHYGQNEAGRATGAHQSHINACLRGKANTAGGFVWKYRDKENIVIEKKYRVIQYDKSGNEIARFYTAKEAEDLVGVSIFQCLKGEKPSAGGFVWRKVGDDFNKYRTERKDTKKVMDIRTKKVYNSIKEGAKSCGMKPATLRMQLMRGNGYFIYC